MRKCSQRKTGLKTGGHGCDCGPPSDARRTERGIAEPEGDRLHARMKAPLPNSSQFGTAVGGKSEANEPTPRPCAVWY